MIPILLSLTNFLSYHERTELDFSGIHVACLSGDNGHGKSALLDAITWAIWGKARGSDDELVHLGEMEMQVELEFELRGERYRVLRKRRRGGLRRGDTTLELQACGPEGWRSISGNSVRATQHRIIDLVGLDYDTFVNSAFLMQGRADEFTTRTPADRKKVLGEILGLRYYDELAERAKLKVRERTAKRTELQAELDYIQRQTADLPRLREQAQAVRIEVENCEAALREQEAACAGLADAKRAADFQAEQLRAAQSRLREAEEMQKRLCEETEQLQASLQARLDIIAREAEIARAYEELLRLRSEEAEYGRRAGESLALTEERHRLETAIERSRGELAHRAEAARREAADLEARAAGLESLHAKHATIEQLRREAAEFGTALAQRREEARAARDEAQQLEATNRALRAAMDDLRRKLDELAAAQATCPLCARPLAPADKDRIEATYEAEGSLNAQRFRENEGRRRSLAAAADELERQAAALEREHAERERHIALELSALERDREDAQRAADALPDAQRRAREFDDALAGASFAVEERQALALIAERIDALGYDAAHHAGLRSRVDELASAEAEHGKLLQARSGAERDREALERCRSDYGEWERRRHEARCEVEGLHEAAQSARQAAERLADAERIRDETKAHLGRLRQALGAVEGEISKSASLLADRPAKAEQLRAVAEEASLYEELCAAFGRRGVQALLIDSALPELMEEANRLLHRMTAGRMSLFITTQRATQKGELAETLDIQIADELGTRAYEMYSGGEAFRIDFALRIALSRLLARRAGAPLPILVVDEGFGSQDATGRERLVEAITAVQDEFRMILAITHIDELRDVFPHRIHVTKTPQGSRLEVL